MSSVANQKTAFVRDRTLIDLHQDQIDGVTMGSPLAAVFANLFLGHHGKILLDNYFYYINTSERPGKLLRVNMISLRRKIS